jgi:tRNA_anti-like
MTGKSKKILLLLLVMVVIGAAAGYFMWNKPHQDVHSAESIKVGAVDLYQSFVTDSILANKKYIDKVVEVTGTVQGVAVNQQNQEVVSLKTASDGAYVNCTMEQADAIVKEGTVATLKGICSGLGQGDADLGILGDVYLIRCYTAE